MLLVDLRSLQGIAIMLHQTRCCETNVRPALGVKSTF